MRFGLHNPFSGRRTFRQAMQHLASKIKVTTVIDVGVADGTPELYRAFPDQFYLLVEADPFYKDTLIQLTRTLRGTWHLAFCGDGEKTDFFINTDHGKSTKYSRGGEEARVAVESVRLDTLAAPYFDKGPILLKIDVEGAQLEVLKGAGDTLKHCQAIILEAPLKSPGGAFFGDLIAYLIPYGFIVSDIFDISYKNGDMNLCNIIFIKK